MGVRQTTLPLLTPGLRGGPLWVFPRPPPLAPALFPPRFRPPVNPMTQEHSFEFLLAAPGIQHRVPRRTLSPHTALQSVRFHRVGYRHYAYLHGYYPDLPASLRLVDGFPVR